MNKKLSKAAMQQYQEFIEGCNLVIEFYSTPHGQEMLQDVLASSLQLQDNGDDIVTLKIAGENVSFGRLGLAMALDTIVTYEEAQAGTL